MIIRGKNYTAGGALMSGTALTTVERKYLVFFLNNGISFSGIIPQ